MLFMLQLHADQDVEQVNRLRRIAAIRIKLSDNLFLTLYVFDAFGRTPFGILQVTPYDFSVHP